MATALSSSGSGDCGHVKAATLTLTLREAQAAERSTHLREREARGGLDPVLTAASLFRGSGGAGAGSRTPGACSLVIAGHFHLRVRTPAVRWVFKDEDIPRDVPMSTL